LGSLAAAAQIRGDYDTAWAALHHSIELARTANNPARMRFGRAVLSGTLALAGELDRAREVLKEAETAGRDTVDTIVLDVAVRLSWEAGDLSLVAREAPRVAALSAPMQQCWLLTCAAMAAAETGDPATAAQHLDTIERYLGRRPFWIISDHFAWAVGRVAMAGGDLATAVIHLEDAARALCDTGALPYAAYLLADLAEASALAGQPAAAARAATMADDAAQRLDRNQFRALAGIAASAASLSLGQRTAATQHARKALALLSGRGYHLLEARGLALLGLSLRTVDRQEAVDRFRLAAELFGTCGSRWRREAVLAELNSLGKPGQRAAASCLGPGSLTDREHEVAALAVQGLTAKAIGQQLHIGQRTVETHIAHVYAKLNVQTRRDLVHALGHHARGAGST
jgi:ATP/maltotriose-dependent transcriptional regulator MalT